MLEESLAQPEPDVKLIKCPTCKGDCDEWDFLTPTSVIIMPCSHCDGEGNVLDGSFFNEEAGAVENWTKGQLEWEELPVEMELPI